MLWEEIEGASRFPIAIMAGMLGAMKPPPPLPRSTLCAALLLLTVLSSGVRSLTAQEARTRAERIRTPLVRIHAVPETFQGKDVLISGACSQAFESSALYADEYSRAHGFCQNALWMDTSLLSKEELEKLEKAHGKAIHVIGVFDATTKGHFGLFSGTVKVTRFVMASPTAAP